MVHNGNLEQINDNATVFLHMILSRQDRREGGGSWGKFPGPGSLEKPAKSMASAEF